MKNTNILLWVMLLLTFGTSCTYVYYPTYPVVPDTKTQGAGVQATVGFTRAQLSGWYNFDSNFYVTGNFGGALSTLNSTDSNSGRTYNALSATAGLGYRVMANEKFEFQLQGGIGYCKGQFHSTVFNDLSKSSNFFDPVDIETESIRGFIQPSFGFISRRGGGFYIIPRINYESFQSVRLSNNLNNVSQPLKPRNFLMTELYGLGRINAKVINIDLYCGLSTNLFYQNANSNENESFIAQPFLFGAGVSKTFD